MRYVAFLRGMNLGRRRITNVELCACFESMGFSGVTAFQASGNVIFAIDGSDDGVEGVLEEGLARQLGYAVPVFVRESNELAKLARHEPFAGHTRRSGGKVQVIFLGRNAKPADAKKASALATNEDWLAPRRRELLWWPAGGLSESALDLKAIEAICGPVTVRTRHTIERLCSKLAAS